jgi:hypothetical protein
MHIECYVCLYDSFSSSFVRRSVLLEKILRGISQCVLHDGAMFC